MKKAIVFYSLTGNTRQTAEKIAELTGADLIEIAPQKSYPDKGAAKFFWGGKSAVMGEKPPLMPYEFKAEEYDMIIFGTPVWASNFTPPLRTFIEENSGVKKMKTAVFTCFSGGGAEKALEKLRKLLEADSFAAKLILTDPKDKPNAENDEKIKTFCGALQ